MAAREAKVKLQLSLIESVEILFTTLSMSARNIMESLHQGFPTIIVDEAAQANELSTLLPLKLGCRRMVLVGDPNQLPATVRHNLNS